MSNLKQQLSLKETKLGETRKALDLTRDLLQKVKIEKKEQVLIWISYCIYFIFMDNMFQYWHSLFSSFEVEILEFLGLSGRTTHRN